MFWSFSSPFQEIENFRRQVNDVFQQYNTAPQFPGINIYESAESVDIVAELPGFAREDLDIQLDNGVLHLKGERAAAEDNEQRVALRKERSQHTFEKKIQLTTEFDVDNLSAELNHGMLTVRLPKAARAQAKRIAIQ